MFALLMASFSLGLLANGPQTSSYKETSVYRNRLVYTNCVCYERARRTKRELEAEVHIDLQWIFLRVL
jgi:hypothetical protein